MDCDLPGYDAASAGSGNYGALEMRMLSYLGKLVLD
jgi:hypothetical protein